MKEIKCRAWDKKINKFHFWDSISQPYDNIFWHMAKEEDMPVTQFSGLKDKNGKEIYEDDIIQKENGVWGVIIYKAPFFEVTISETQSSLYTKEWIEDSEVIGNIYENHELIK